MNENGNVENTTFKFNTYFRTFLALLKIVQKKIART